MCHSHLSWDTDGSWFLCSSLSSFCFAFPSDNFEGRFLSLRSLDLEGALSSSGRVFLSEVASFVFLSVLTPSSRPVRDVHVNRYEIYKILTACCDYGWPILLDRLSTGSLLSVYLVFAFSRAWHLLHVLFLRALIRTLCLD